MDTAPKFTLTHDRTKRRLTWTMRGFWDVADVAAFGAALRATFMTLGPPPFHLDCVSDARDFPVQSGDVADALSAISRAGAGQRIGRFAVVVGSMMNKLQAQRSLGGDVRTFLKMEDAVAWLDEDAAVGG